MAKGILFDKDGTLFAFDSLWKVATMDFLTAVTTKVAQPEVLAKKLGVVNGEIKGNSILTSGTPYELANEIFIAGGFDSQLAAEKFVKDFFYQYLVRNLANIKPFGNLGQLFSALRAKGYYLGIVTSDELQSTMTTLDYAEVTTYFDFIATSDHYPTKPNPMALTAFCEQTGLTNDDVIVVGDSIMDIKLGQQAKAGVAVLSGTGSKADFIGLTPYIYDNIQTIPYQKILAE